jgi:O-antigen ligase
MTRKQRIAQIIFIALIFASFTRLAPFAERHGYTSVLDTGSGDLLRQIYYIALLAFTLIISHKEKWLQMPLAFLVLYLWFGLTLLWSPTPLVGVRRYSLSVIVAIIIFYSLSHLSFDRIFRTLHSVMFALIFAGLLAAPFLYARTFHIGGDTEVGVIGDFRGIFYHKNQLGIAAAIEVFLSLWYISKKDRKFWLGWVALICAVASLIISNSKTPLGFTALCIPIYFLWVRSRLMRFVVPLTFCCMLVFSVLFYDRFIEILSDPEAFTGRVYIWTRTFDIFLQNPIFGVGYLSIFQTGEHTLFAAGSSNVFYATLAQAHNSYLEIAASTGLIGLVLLINTLNVNIFLAIPGARLDLRDEAMVATLFFLILLVNIQESGLGDRDYAMWIVIMIIMSALKGRYTFSRQAKSRLSGERSRPTMNDPQNTMDAS